MHKSKKAVVIPAYKVSEQIIEVVSTIPDMIDFIIVVDDACPEKSGKLVEDAGIKKVTVIYHKKNQGVGDAVISGYKKAMELGCDIVVKIDGDGQMDPSHIEELIKPLENNEADYMKGNRFRNIDVIRKMPKLRLMVNNLLSFFVKVCSGYWNIMDPVNGYTAIHRRVLDKLKLDKIAKRYFFESDMLLNLYLINAVVKEFPMQAKYGTETSSLTAKHVLVQFPARLIYGLVRRILLKYYIYDFNMASVYILLGIPLFIWSIVLGSLEWIESARTGIARPAGTVILAALPLIISVEMLLQAIHIDINSFPKKGNS